MSTIPHLHFNGNCAEAFAFYARTLGGTVAFQMKYGEAPRAVPCRRSRASRSCMRASSSGRRD